MVDLNISLPDNFFEREERDGYYVSEDRKKVWAVELDLLQFLLDVCKRHDIQLWVDGGTMLGAVRHGGFIPWDDDMDIIMTRENYNKLCKIAGQEFKYPYFFQTDYTDPGSMRGHAQLRNSETTGILKHDYEYKYHFNQGIFIDIFPLDFIPEDEKEKYFKKLDNLIHKAKRYSRLTVRYDETKNDDNLIKGTAKKICHDILKSRKYENKYFKKFEDIVSENDKVPTSSVGKLFWGHVKERSIWGWEWFNDTLEVPFEMLMVPIPVGYEECLNKFYGPDWETPRQVSASHGDVIFDTERSYKDYINGLISPTYI